MNIPAPHFLLFSEAKGKKRQGQWRFVLQAADGSATLEAEDQEPEVGGERLELLGKKRKARPERNMGEAREAIARRIMEKRHPKPKRKPARAK